MKEIKCTESKRIYNAFPDHIYVQLMCVLMSTRKRTNRLQYSVCKCEVESTGKLSNIGVLFNQLHFNPVPKGLRIDSRVKD
jgi:CRISPR/Cas system-associated endoribonuclease Cas2